MLYYLEFLNYEGDDDVTKYNKFCVTLDSTAVSFGYCGLCTKYELKEIPRWSEGANVSLKQHYTACVKANCGHQFFYINEDDESDESDNDVVFGDMCAAYDSNKNWMILDDDELATLEYEKDFAN